MVTSGGRGGSDAEAIGSACCCRARRFGERDGGAGREDIFYLRLAGRVGQTGAPADTFFFGGQEVVPNDSVYVVPAGGGTVVRLNTESAIDCNTRFGFAQGTYNLQVLRPLGGNQYMVLGNTGRQLDPCDGQLHSYPVSIPVQAGDVLGVYVVTNWKGALSGGTGVHFAFRAEPAVGDTFPVPSNDARFTVDMSATLAQLPTSKSDCKKGGWRNLDNDKGKPFKNQGACVSFVAKSGGEDEQ